MNVLDEVYNPGLREAIKNYSQWPTIPQVCIVYGVSFMDAPWVVEWADVCNNDTCS